LTETVTAPGHHAPAAEPDISPVPDASGHFVVGAVKSIFTLRSWWSSGLEMTVAGILVGGATYALGLVFKVSGV